jgi:hypothetical protein
VGNALDAITDATIEALIKAQTNGINVGTGLAGYNLFDVVSLVPVKSVTFDRMRRVSAPMGATAAHWQAFTSLNNAQPNPFTGFDGGGDLVKFNRMDLSSAYFPVRTTARVSLDSIDVARGYDDARNRAIVGGAYQWRMMDNKSILAGQNYALPAMPALGALQQADTGGTIAASTAVYVKVQARSYYNWYWGGSGVAVAANASTGANAAATHSMTIPSWASVPGAAGYDIFAGPSAGTLYYVTTVTTNAAYTLTAIPTQNAAVPSLPQLYSTVPTPATVDASFNANSYNGLFATIYGDYNASGAQVTPGTGVLPSGATTVSLGGAQLAGSGANLTDIDNFLLSYFTATGGESPDVILLNAQEAQTIKNKITASGSASVYLEPQDKTDRSGIVGGGNATGYINGNTGDFIPFVTEPHLPPGRIAFAKESIPFPEQNGSANTFEVQTLREVSQRQLPVPRVLGAGGGPAEEYDISSAETFINRAPMLCGVITDIAKG